MSTTGAIFVIDGMNVSTLTNVLRSHCSASDPCAFPVLPVVKGVSKEKV
jgi:hypothetical protein